VIWRDGCGRIAAEIAPRGVKFIAQFQEQTERLNRR
jgi:hypothetical protein